MSARILETGKIASRIIRMFLAVKPGEEVLIITDPVTPLEMVYSLATAAYVSEAETTIATMPCRQPGNDVLPKTIEKAYEGADVVIGMNGTSGAPSLAPINVRLLAEKKIRYMSMVKRSLDNWTKGSALANYEDMYKMAVKLAEVLGKGKRIRVATEAGTDLVATIEGRRAIIEAGFARNPGESAAFSDGEVSVSPVEGSTEGVIVVDGPMGYIGYVMPSEPVKMVVRGGRVVSIEGDGRVDQLREWVATLKGADNVAEIGIGVNPMARRLGDYQEEKKALGGIHIAIGRNLYWGGSVETPLHIDMVNRARATVEVNGRTILKNGIFTSL